MTSLMCDGIFILFICLCIYLGSVRGFLGLGQGVLTFVIALVLVFLTSSSVTKVVYQSDSAQGMFTNLKLEVEKSFTTYLETDSEFKAQTDVVDKISLAVEKLKLSKTSLTADLGADLTVEDAQAILTTDPNELKSSLLLLSKNMVDIVIIKVLNIVVILLLFIIYNIIVAIVLKIGFKGLASLPIIKQVNKLLGGVMGLLLGLGILVLLSYILNMNFVFSTYTSETSEVVRLILNSNTYKFIVALF